jgi:hypothetical protein
MANALSCLCNTIETIGIPNQTNDANLFIIQSKWL